MKKIKVCTGISLVLALVLSGCASTGAKKDLSSLCPIAVASISADGSIRWDDEKKTSSGLLGGMIDKTVNNAQNSKLSAFLSRADVLVQDVDPLLTDAFGKQNIQLVAKPTVINAVAYQNAKTDKVAVKAGFIQPKDYRLVDVRDAAFAQSLAREIGAQGTLFLEFTFLKQMSTGLGKNGTMRAQVQMLATLIDANGKAYFQKIYTASSKDTIGVAMEVYDMDKFMEMIPPVVTTVIEQFTEDFSK